VRGPTTDRPVGHEEWAALAYLCAHMGGRLAWRRRAGQVAMRDEIGSVLSFSQAAHIGSVS
jgi:hypothetical protein